MTTDDFPVATSPAPGLHGVDWENRVDFDRLRGYRLARVKEQLEASDLGAVLLFETSNIRYATSTHIGYWAFNKGERYALITRTGPPRIWDFGSAAKAHRLQLPQLYDMTNSVGGNTGLQGAISPAVGLQKRAAEEIRSVLKEDGVGDMPLGVDLAETTVFLELQRAGIDVRDGQQVMMLAREIKSPDEIDPAHAGVRDGRRRVSGHLRVPEARCPGERRRRAGAQAAVRDGLGVRRGDQLDRRRALQPAPARVLGPVDPPGRPGVLRHHPRRTTAIGRATTARSWSAARPRRSATRSSGRANGWTPRSIW